MSLRPFFEADIWRIDPQPLQALGAEERWRILRESMPRGPCWTYQTANGHVCGVGGFVELHPEWLTAWTILAADIGMAMFGLSRAVAGVIRSVSDERGDNARIDMHVDPASLESVRWAMLLGFRQDAILPRALPGGRPMGVWSYERGQRG